jgi:ribonucleoside-diphosphate reductase beta chain
MASVPKKLQAEYDSLFKKRTLDPLSLNKFITENEPLLKKNPNRFTLFPVKYIDIYEAYIKHQSTYWVPNEIRYDEDLTSWAKLTMDEKYFVEHILAFFAGSDGLVMENISINFSSEFQVQEIALFYNFQNMIEGVHSETYSRLIDTFIKDPVRKDNLFKAITNIPCIQKKAEWTMKWFDPVKNIIAERLVAFCAVEGIFFSGAFCALYWLKERGLMTKALAVSNEFIARDEGLHCNFGILLYNHLLFKLSPERITEIFKSAVDVEIEFITESLPCRLIGMTSEMMIEYIKFVCDYRLVQFKVPKLYNAKNPFPFMEKLAINGKTNFFESTVTNYIPASSVIKDFDVSDLSGGF